MTDKPSKTIQNLMIPSSLLNFSVSERRKETMMVLITLFFLARSLEKGGRGEEELEMESKPIEN